MFVLRLHVSDVTLEVRLWEPQRFMANAKGSSLMQQQEDDMSNSGNEMVFGED